MIRKSIAFIGLLGCLHADEFEDISSKRIHAHFFLKDYQMAHTEAKSAFDKNSESRVHLENYIIASFRFGQESKALMLFEEYQKRYGIEKERTDFLEDVAFSVIQCALSSSNAALRAMAMIAAFHANDARGVAILKKGLSDRCAVVRAITIKLVSKLRDKMLQQEIMDIIAKERLYDLKLDAIRAVGTMKIQEAKEILVRIISSGRDGDEAIAAAIEAYINLDNTLRIEDLRKMAVSQRSGFRQLADVVIAHLGLEDEIAIPLKHLSDSHQDVKRNAIIALGRLVSAKDFPKEQILEKLKILKNDREDSTKIASLWLMTLLSPVLSEEGFLECLKNPNIEVRVRAASAIGHTGFLGQDLILKAYLQSECPFVKLNLALAMIPLGLNVQDALNTVKEALLTDERFSVMEDALAEAIVPSKLKVCKDEAITPEAMNQMIRLKLINILAIKNDPETTRLLRAFLKERRWGITGVVSALLLSEGDDEAKLSVEGLLDDPDKKVRVQAAFVLATWKHGEKSLDILKEAYEGVDRDLKVKMLEAMGHIGNKTLLPFLAGKLSEPFPTLRLATSLAIIQTIYH